MKSKSHKSFQVFIIVAACFILSMFFGCSNFLQDVMDNVSDIEVDYKVEHWKQSLDGKSYELDAQESQILQGTSLTKTQAQSKDFEGFISKKIEQQKIKRDGSTIVKIYYDRKSITYIFKAQGGNWNQDSSDQTKTGLYGAALDVPANPVKTGYTFSKWSSDVPETFGSSDITFVASWLPGTGTLYKVEYYLQNTDGSDYERIDDDSQNLVGTTGELTAAVAKEYEGFTVEEIAQKEIAPDGSTVVPVYYKRNSISYIFAANGGNWNGSSDNKTVSGLYECSVTAPGAPVKTGYVFGGWSEEVPDSFGSEAKSFSAVWLASTDTVYKVEHWQQNIDDDEYTKVDSDTQNLTGVTDAYTNAVSKLYSGFTVKSLAQKKIMPDGTTIVRIYYDRNEIVYTFAGEGGKWNNSVITQTVEGRFGSEVVYPGQPERTGYNFLKWNSTVPSTFGVGNQTFSAEWVAKTDTIYKVEHWQQNIIDDGYTLVETDTKYGTTAAQTNALAKIYTGFTSQEVIQKKIAAEGNTIIRINYNRDIIDYTFNTAGGTFSDNLTSKIVSGKYGSTIITPESPNRVGYSFENWDNSIPTTFGENARTFTANWAARTDTIYKVEHWWQNINDDEYTKYTTESKQGTTAEQTVALAKSYEGFESQGVTQQEIAADGSTVIRINYNRKNITYTFNPNGGNWNNSTAVQIRSGKYGGAFSIPNPVRTGYTFSSWDKTVPSVFGTKNDTFTTNWNANTNTAYKVEHYQQNINDDGYTIVSNDTQNLTGTTATQTNAAAKYYLGFSVKSYNQSSIAPDGSTVVKIYYDRDLITYTFNPNGGNWNGSTSAQTRSGRYGASFSKPANPTRIGYTFSSWSSTVPSTFGTSSEIYTTSWKINTYTVTFNSNGGSSVTNKKADYNTTITEPSVPTKDNYSFAGWYKDKGLNNKYSFSSPVTGNMTLYARWYMHPVTKITVNSTQYDKTEEVTVINSSVTVIGENPPFVEGNSYKGVFCDGETVTLKPFVMSKYEVTRELYKIVMMDNGILLNETPLSLDEAESNLPVANVTGYDVLYFCNILTEKTLGPEYKVYNISNISVNNGHITKADVSMDQTKIGYRLPSEAEWEFAARGGEPTLQDWNYKYSGSENNWSNVCWCYDNVSQPKPKPVGGKKSNRLDIYDMSGNVWECCCEQRNEKLYLLVRGGGVNEFDYGCTVCYKKYYSGSAKDSFTGFRVVRSIPE